MFEGDYILSKSMSPLISFQTSDCMSAYCIAAWELPSHCHHLLIFSSRRPTDRMHCLLSTAQVYAGHLSPVVCQSVHGPTVHVCVHTAVAVCNVMLHNSCMATYGPEALSVSGRHVFPMSVQPSHAGIRGWSTLNKRGCGLEGRCLLKFPPSSACGRSANRQAETGTAVSGTSCDSADRPALFLSLTLNLPLFFI